MMKRVIVIIMVLTLIMGDGVTVLAAETGANESIVLEESSTKASENYGLIIEDGIVMGYTGAPVNIVIPEGVTGIGLNAFKDTQWLMNKREKSPLVIVNNILVDAQTCKGKVKIPSTVKKISDFAFANATITSIKMPSSVKEIGYCAFHKCYNLKSIEIPSSVTEIGDYAFVGCSSLTNIKIPSGVKEIGECAFYNCSKLKKATLGSAVKIIKNDVFGKCKNLKTITIKSKKLKTVGDEAFKDINANAKIKVPKSKLASYKNLLKGKGQGSKVKIVG